MSFDEEESLGKVSLSLFEPLAFVHDGKTEIKNCHAENNNDNDESGCSDTMDVEPNISEHDPSDNMIEEQSPTRCFFTDNKSNCDRSIIVLSSSEENGIESISSMDTEKILRKKMESKNLPAQHDDKSKSEKNFFSKNTIEHRNDECNDQHNNNSLDQDVPMSEEILSDENEDDANNDDNDDNITCSSLSGNFSKKSMNNGIRKSILEIEKRKSSQESSLLGINILCHERKAGNDIAEKSLTNQQTPTNDETYDQSFASSKRISSEKTSDDDSDFTKSHNMQQLRQTYFEKEKISSTNKNKKNNNKTNTLLERKRKIVFSNQPPQGKNKEGGDMYNYICREPLTVLRFILSKYDKGGNFSKMGEELQELAWLWEITEMIQRIKTKDNYEDKSDNWDYIRQNSSISLNRFLAKKEIDPFEIAYDHIPIPQQNLFKQFQEFLKQILESRKKRVLRRHKKLF